MNPHIKFGLIMATLFSCRSLLLIMMAVAGGTTSELTGPFWANAALQLVAWLLFWAAMHKLAAVLKGRGKQR